MDKYDEALGLLAKAEGEAIQRECEQAVSRMPFTAFGWFWRWFGGPCEACDPPAVEVGD